MSLKKPDGSFGPLIARYFVTLESRPHEEAVVDDEHIIRDRKIFTKQVLRSFIKRNVTREAWTGAPWLVKEDVAREYHIDTNVPARLQYSNKLAEKKANQALKKNDPDSSVLSFVTQNGQRLPELKPAPKSHKSKQLQ